MADSNLLNVLLADDDVDDCLLFKDALEELDLPTELKTVHNGESLMKLLLSLAELPDVLFLDLNMPRKNGFECLSEIKQKEKLRHLPVVIFSTSFDPEIVDLLYKKGAQYYICKPNEYGLLLKVIHHAITIIPRLNSTQPSIDDFVLSPENCLQRSS